MWQREQDEGLEKFCCLEGWGPPSALVFPNHSSGSGNTGQAPRHGTSHPHMRLNGDNQKRCVGVSEVGSWLQPASGPTCSTARLALLSLCPSSLLTPGPPRPCPCLRRRLHPWEQVPDQQEGGKCRQHLKLLKEVPPGQGLPDRGHTVQGSRNLPRLAAPRHSSCPHPQTVSFSSSQENVGVWGPLEHKQHSGRFIVLYVHSAGPAMAFVPNGESRSCYCHCWNGSKVPSRLVYAGLALPRPGAGGQVAGSLSWAGLGQGGISGTQCHQVEGAEAVGSAGPWL